MGLKEKLLGLFGASDKSESTVGNPEFDKALESILQEASKDKGRSWWYDISLGKLESYQKVKSLDNTKKRELIFYMVSRISYFKKIHNGKRMWTSNDSNWYNYNAYSEILSSLLRSNLDFSAGEIKTLLEAYKTSDTSKVRNFVEWPIGFSVQQMEKSIKKNGLTDELKNFIQEFLTWPQMSQKKSYWGSDLEKVRVKLEKLIFESEDTEGRTPPYRLPSDRLADLINPQVDALGDARDPWYELFHLFIKATASKPSAKYLRDTGEVIDGIGIKRYKEVVHPWIEFACTLKEIETIKEYDYGGGDVYQYSSYEFLHEKSTVFLKGLVWSLTKFHDSKTLNLVARLTERSFKKIPGVGPTAAGVGNACIYVLGNTKGLEGISHLSRLKLKIKQNNTRKLIERYLDEASSKMGVSSSEIEEMSIPDFGLENGQRSYEFDEYILKLEIAELGKVTVNWLKPDGKSQKTTPSFVKDSVKHSQNLKKIKSEVAQIKKYITAQRDRIDRLYLDDRTWDFEDFNTHYLNHGLVSFIAKRLIWELEFTDGRVISAMHLNDSWTDVAQNSIENVENCKVRLWHPINSGIDQVMLWRNRLDELKVKQPMKQAFREVYILTDAEINTRVYSNRMAAHLLKQHQFNALAAVRGWKYKLMGAFDNGIDAEMATIKIKPHEIEAQFWINEVNADDAFNDTGIWDYVATDQVRFVREDGEVINLIDIPKIVFSEVMRNVDLFVGVCSVGNDPEWRDNGGLPQYRDYWTSYSFGELTEVAKTRKEILERLLPRLKINEVASIDGKFLKVVGTKRTYKIHIGSTNILMEPNDQYLCIVPARGKDAKTENVFLPFEGDRGLSLVLSKAFLLAEDNKITDSTILTQINR